MISLKDRMDMYENPVDIATILAENARGYMTTLVSLFDDNIETFKKLGVTPVVKVPKYSFFAVDYGFMVYAFMVMCKESKVDENKIRLLETQFTKQNESFAKNGAFFVAVLEYLGVSFRRKNNFFYTRHLYFNSSKKVYFIHNSIAVNSSAIKSFLNTLALSDFEENARHFTPEVIAYENNVEAQLKLIKKQNDESIKVVMFSDKTGLNKKIFNF